MRIGPEVCAWAALLTCAHYLPMGRARWERNFLAHTRKLLAGAPAPHAEETPGPAAGTPTYVHPACTE
ncbi:hypothetical protein ACOJVU_11410 [Mycobacterium sp. THU-M104]|uniref:hypothetical protein n=1 Tax=Mycobacterium sp. THU-M104 TaxID=3410515 RepID=UPI003B9C28B9